MIQRMSPIFQPTWNIWSVREDPLFWGYLAGLVCQVPPFFIAVMHRDCAKALSISHGWWPITHFLRQTCHGHTSRSQIIYPTWRGRLLTGILWHPLKVTSWGIKKCSTTRVFVPRKTKHGDFSIHLFPGFLAGPVEDSIRKICNKSLFSTPKKILWDWSLPWFSDLFLRFTVIHPSIWWFWCMTIKLPSRCPDFRPRTPNLEPCWSRWPKKTVVMVYSG